jgi:hypothetical protein
MYKLFLGAGLWAKQIVTLCTTRCMCCIVIIPYVVSNVNWKADKTATNLPQIITDLSKFIVVE